MWCWPAGLVTLLALALLWHEPGAPRYVWLSLLVVIALLRVLPEGRLAAAVRAFRTVCWVLFILIAIPFVYQQVRSVLYPQLDRPWVSPGVEIAERRETAEQPGTAAPAPPVPMPMEDAPVSEEAKIAENAEALSVGRSKVYPGSASESGQAANYREIDPNAITQTGPGVPRWHWTTVPLSWNGPVLMGQDMRFLLLSPGANLIVNLIRIALLLWLATLFFGDRGKLGRGPLPLLLCGLLVPPLNARADFPSPALLDQLAQRLVEAPDCLPGCAEIPRLQFNATPGELQQTLEIHVWQRVMVPLPAQEDQWWPNRVSVDGAAADSLMRSQGGLLLGLEAGHHRIVLAGPLPRREQLQLPLPLRPRRVEVTSIGWAVEGVQQAGPPASFTTADRRSEGGRLTVGPAATRCFPAGGANLADRPGLARQHGRQAAVTG